MQVTFYNWSTEDMTVSWNGKQYPVKAGELLTDFVRSASGDGLVLEQGIVETFARQLGDREANRLNVNPQRVDQWEEIRNRALLPPQKYSDVPQKPEPYPDHLKHLAKKTDEKPSEEKEEPVKKSKKSAKKAEAAPVAVAAENAAFDGV